MSQWTFEWLYYYLDAKYSQQENLSLTLYLLLCEDYNVLRHMITFDQPEGNKRQNREKNPAKVLRNIFKT